MNLKEQINKNKLPVHVAIIMDGNGRWAKKKGNNRLFGHKKGVVAVREVCEASAELGIPYLTLYAFSKENWQRPKSEINGLMSLLVQTIESEMKTLMDNNIKLSVIGDISSLPESVCKGLDKAMDKTKNNERLTLVLALSYGARWEIINAVNKMYEEIKNINNDDIVITEEDFRRHLTTAEMPDPAMLIRTGGEKRISNFLLWQISYSELYFTDVLWPDFRKNDYYKAILDYQARERRFGKISEQTKK